MSSESDVPEALVVSGDDRIRKLLTQKGAAVVPASAFFLDGFVKDTATEYANDSIYRPPSVCKARLVSTLRDQYQFKETGKSYFGFTMYTAAGQDEPVDMWVGHRCVARAHLADPDNRVHLFVAPEPVVFQGGELKRLITAATPGPCRIENLVLLPKRPQPTPAGLDIRSFHVDVRLEEGKIRAFLTWITSRPASGVLRWGAGKTRSKTVKISGPLANHEIVLSNLDRNKTYSFEIRLKDRTGAHEAVHAGTFKTDLPVPESRTKRARMPILARRPAAAAMPVSVGVPFPKGALGGPAELRLLNGRREVPLQVRVLARWEDGSVRWGLLDFVGDGKEAYTLEYGRDVSRTEPADALDVRRTRTGITVTTGPLKVEFPRDRVVFPGLVSFRQPDGTYRRLSPANPSPAVTLTSGDGGRTTSGRPDAVVLEESGPERVCVRIDCTHRTGSGKALFRSTFRVHLFRDSSAIRVFHTFENDRDEDTFTHIRDLTLRADLDVGENPAARLGRRKLDPRKPATLHQGRDDHYRLTQGRTGLAKGRRADGTADLSGSGGGVALAVRDFWQNYPKGLGIDEAGLTVGICPPLDARDYPRGGELEDRLYYALLDGAYTFKYGVSRTHEMWLHVRSGGAAPAGFFDAVQNPPLYSVSLKAFNKSRALTRQPSKDNSPYPPYEAWVETAREAYAEDREESRAYGMLNYGDWFGERVYNWGNMEYDTPWCFLQEYLRGGHPDFFTWAEEAARHLVDVDTCHSSPNAGEIGAQYLHSVGHVGNYYPEGYRERAIFTGRWSVSHTWVEGLFLYHLLTGDARALESAMKTSDLLVGGMLNDYDFTNCRNCGWHLIHLAAAYKATGRRVYLNGARIIADRVLERQRPSGGWNRLMVPGHCFCHPLRHTGNAGFMVGILMNGLTRFYEATGDKRVRDAVVRAALFCIDDMWVPENRAFRYTSCPQSSVGRSADMGILTGIAAAYGYAPNAKLKAVLFEGARSAMADRRTRAGRGVGKSIGMPMRDAPQVLVDLPGD